MVAAFVSGFVGLLVGLILGLGVAAVPETTPTDSTAAARSAAAVERAVAERTGALDREVEQLQAAIVAAEKSGDDRVASLKQRAKKQQKKAVRRAVAAARTQERRKARNAIEAAVREAEREADARIQQFTKTPTSPSDGGTDPRFSYCYEANDAGYGHYVEGVDEEYYWYVDRDGDGVVCE